MKQGSQPAALGGLLSLSAAIPALSLFTASLIVEARPPGVEAEPATGAAQATDPAGFDLPAELQRFEFAREFDPTAAQLDDLELAPDLAESGSLSTAEIESRLGGSLEQALAATVAIRTEPKRVRGGRYGTFASGAGVIVSAEGLVLTAGHVVTEPGTEVSVTLSDGTEVEGTALGVSLFSDAGMVQLDPHPEGADYPFSNLVGAGDSPHVGDWCYSIGHPGGPERRRGPVLRLGRILSVDPFTLRSTCKLLGGDSGGPLFDLEGRIIGINSRISAEIDENFHATTRAFERRWDALVDGKTLGENRGWVGLSFSPHNLAVQEVAGGSGAENIFEIGDVVTHVDGVAVPDFLFFEGLVAECGPGETVEVTVQREGQPLARTITLTESPWPNQEYIPRLRPVTEVTEDRVVAALLDATTPTGIPSDALDRAKSATVSVRAEGGPGTIVQGTVIAPDTVVTKASEIEEVPLDRLRIATATGNRSSRLPVTSVAVDGDNDLAFLKVRPGALPEPVELARGNLGPGHVVAAVAGRAGELEFGVTGTRMRPIELRSGVLGVSLDTERRLRNGILIELVHPGGGAEAAGIQPGDVIVAAAGTPVSNPKALREIVFSHYPGDVLPIVIKREGRRLELDVTLAHWTVNDRATRLLQENIDVSGPLSRRVSGFTRAAQHDIQLTPREIGSPLLDAKGRAVGINIARADRVTTYALPSRIVERAMDKAEPRPESEPGPEPEPDADSDSQSEPDRAAGSAGGTGE